ncbi:hypothetical protein [Lysinibacillus cavernae]|uniref:hypothetical protein n=1 Tax=Lysinibacillus cavernae TaxID=2666135 RepID=UPI0012D94FC5|nr:hypothetical protein [Lysinibacillus cavernae]
MKAIMKDETEEILNTNFVEILCMINQGRGIENEQNFRECMKKCIKLQVGLLNSIELVERTYLELHNKYEHTHLALNAESNT